MTEILAERNRKAVKCCVCDCCGEAIQKGEVYDWMKLIFDGRLYEWKSHKKCSFITTALWSIYLVSEPSDDMTGDDFNEGCAAFCRDFICPDCPSFEREKCKEEKNYCVEKIYNLLQTHGFRRDPEKPWEWRRIPKEIDASYCGKERDGAVVFIRRPHVN